MSNPNKKPLPLFDVQIRPMCPICGHASYSRAGIHPQCAMAAEDKVHSQRISAHRLAEPTPPVSMTTLRRHEKRCPRCMAVHPLRRHKCECGHTFFS
jgi:hypothetical protein